MYIMLYFVSFIFILQIWTHAALTMGDVPRDVSTTVGELCVSAMGDTVSMLMAKRVKVSTAESFQDQPVS